MLHQGPGTARFLALPKFVDPVKSREEFDALTAEQQELDREVIRLGDLKNDSYNQHLIDHPEDITVMPGTQAILDYLEAQGVKMAVASSSKNTPTILKLTNLERYFLEVISGHCLLYTSDAADE